MDSQRTVQVLGIRMNWFRVPTPRKIYHLNQIVSSERPDTNMGLTICKGYSSTVTVTIVYSDCNECANAGRWRKWGWWSVAPGQCVRVYSGSLKNFNRYWAYYSRTTDRSRKWIGNYCTYVIHKVFHQCWNDPSLDPGFSGYYQVCYRLLDINSYDNYTLTLTWQVNWVG